MPTSRQQWSATLGYYSLFVCLGLGLGIGGPTIPALAGQTGVSVARMGLVLLCGSMGATAGTFLGGWLFDRVRGHALLGAAVLVAAGCLALLPVVPAFWMLVAVAVVRGVAEGVINTGGNTLLLWTHGERASPFMNGLHFSWGVGAFVAPFIVARLTGWADGWRWAYWAVAAFASLAGLRLLLLGGSPDPRAHAARARGAGRAGGRLALGAIALAGLYLFAYVGAEISYGSWIYTYAVTLGVASKRDAAELTSAFWFAFTVGRAVSIPVATRFAPRQVIPVALGACLLLSGLLLTMPQSAALVWGTAIGLGFCMAPLWPSGFTLAGQVLPLSGAVASLVLLGDSFGGMVLPSLTGAAIEAAGTAHLALSLPLLVFGALLACAAAFAGLLAAARRHAGRG